MSATKTAADFMAQHEGTIEEAAALTWCEPPIVGFRWNGKRKACRRSEATYRAIVIITTRNRRRSFIRELPGGRLRELTAQFRAEGLRPPRGLRRRCEEAGCAPKILDG